MNVTIRNKKGNEEIIDIVLRNSEGETKLLTKSEISRNNALGAVFVALTNKEMKELNVAYGVKIKSLNTGKLKSVGFEEGMVITKIDNEPIETIEELTTKLNQTGRGILVEFLTKSGKRDYIGIGL